MAEKVFLCGGAAGSQGSALARQLLQSGYKVTTIARSKEKCEQLARPGLDARIGDLADVDSLKAASEDVDYFAFVLPLERDRDKLALYTDSVIEAARAANIRNLVFNTSSRVAAEDRTVPGFAEKRLVEAKLRESALPCIIIRPTIYMENLAAPWSVTDINENSLVKYPLAGDKPVRWNSADDVARYVVAALKKTELCGRVFEIGGPQAVLGQDIAGQFSSALGRNIDYQGITPAEFARSLIPFLGEAQAMGMVSYYEYVNANPESWGQVSEDLALLQCEALDTFEVWVRRMSSTIFTTG